MDIRDLAVGEAAEYEAFRKNRLEAEIALTLRRVIVDASEPTAADELRRLCDGARRLRVYGVLVPPVRVGAAKRLLAGSETRVICFVAGESFSCVKRSETARAVRQGAREVRFAFSRCALADRRENYLRRELRRAKRAAGRASLVVDLSDSALSEDEAALGVRAAREGRADGVCVRGDVLSVLRAAEGGAGRLRVDAGCADDAKQFLLLVRAGAVRVCTARIDALAEALRRETLCGPLPVPVREPPAAPSPEPPSEQPASPVSACKETAP